MKNKFRYTAPEGELPLDNLVTDGGYASIFRTVAFVGDSLSSDIKGGINAGIKTVWVNPEHKNCGDIRPDYEIESLSQLEALLEELQ